MATFPVTYDQSLRCCSFFRFYESDPKVTYLVLAASRKFEKGCDIVSDLPARSRVRGCFSADKLLNSVFMTGCVWTAVGRSCCWGSLKARSSVLKRNPNFILFFLGKLTRANARGYLSLKIIYLLLVSAEQSLTDQLLGPATRKRPELILSIRAPSGCRPHASTNVWKLSSVAVRSLYL